MTIITQSVQSQVISNLDTYQYTVPTAGMYTVSLKINERPVSGITVTTKQNATTVLTTAAPTAPGLISTVTGAGSGPLTAPVTSDIGQQVIDSRIVLNCAANDVLQVIVASSTAHDSKPNDFKGILNIRQGII